MKHYELREICQPQFQIHAYTSRIVEKTRTVVWTHATTIMLLPQKQKN